MAGLLTALAGLLLPTRCLLCHRVGPRQLCETCRGRLELIGPRYCVRCGRRRLTPWASPDCGECHGQRIGVQGARSGLIYNEAGRTLLAEFKYKRQFGAGEALASAALEQLASSARALIEGSSSVAHTFVIPVPMHPRRLRQRRFNQSEFLARRFAFQLGLEPPKAILRRTRETPSQVGLSANQRRENVRGAFEVQRPWRERIRGQAVVIVDDLMTTGATLAACAAALRRVGAATCIGLTVFSTVPTFESAEPLSSAV